MLTTAMRQKSLTLSGGHIVIDQSLIPSYSPNAVSNTTGQHFPWEEDIECINTPDIDPSFFDADPFKKYNTQTSQVMDLTDEEHLLITGNHNCFEDSTLKSSHQSLEDNVFMDLSELIGQNNAENGFKVSIDLMVSPNDVLENQYIPVTTAPVLHYLQPKPIKSIASTLNMEDMTTNTSLIDSITSHSTEESLHHFSSPSHSSSQSYSPLTQSYVSPTPSPALSYTSSTITASSHSHLLSTSTMDAITSDQSNSTIIDGLLDGTDTKPEPTFLQPTVINDHLYTLPSTSASKTTPKRKSSADHKDKYLTVRKKNNLASKKSRVTKRDKQKMMDDQIQHYISDNDHCKREIERMEREIQFCKDYLFKKVVAQRT